MNQVRSLLAVVAAALVLSACEGASSITDPAFRNSKAAPNTQAGSGFHRDNTGAGGSGYDVVSCVNGGSYGSGNDSGSACTAPSLVSSPDAKTGARPTPMRRPGLGAARTRPNPAADCSPDLFNTGAGGSGYNYCPPT